MKLNSNIRTILGGGGDAILFWHATIQGNDLYNFKR